MRCACSSISNFVCRLLENLIEDRDSVVRLKDVYQIYEEEFHQGQHLSCSMFARLLNGIYPDLRKIVSSNTAYYKGVQVGNEAENQNYAAATDQDIIRFSSEFGYQGTRKGPSLVLYKMTSELCNGHSVLKEVHIEEEKIAVQIGSRLVNDTIIPNICKSWNVLRFILRILSEAFVCKGISSDGPVSNCQREHWKWEDGEEVTIWRFIECSGGIVRWWDSKQSCCSKCAQKKRSLSRQIKTVKRKTDNSSSPSGDCNVEVMKEVPPKTCKLGYDDHNYANYVVSDNGKLKYGYDDHNYANYVAPNDENLKPIQVQERSKTSPSSGGGTETLESEQNDSGKFKTTSNEEECSKSNDPGDENCVQNTDKSGLESTEYEKLKSSSRDQETIAPEENTEISESESSDNEKLRSSSRKQETIAPDENTEMFESESSDNEKLKSSSRKQETFVSEENIETSESESSDNDYDDKNDPLYDPSPPKQHTPISSPSPFDVNNLIESLPPGLRTNDAFVDLLRGQALNSLKEKHQRRWDTRYPRSCARQLGSCSSLFAVFVLLTQT